MKPPQRPSRKIKVTLALPGPLIERMRTVVYWTRSLTLATLAEAGIDVALKKLERKKRFPKRRGKIRVGRPPKHGRH